MDRLKPSHAAFIVCVALFSTRAEAQQSTTQLGANVIHQGAGTFQGFAKLRLPLVPLDPQFYVVAQFCDQYGPAVRLANGKTYRLEKTSNSCSGNQINAPPTNPGGFVPKTDVAPKPHASLMGGLRRLSILFGSPAYADTLPPSVSLATQQTSIKNQVRNTCTYYATIAGLEAAYKHKYGIDLDLSERHLNARLKMNLLTVGTDLPWPR